MPAVEPIHPSITVAGVAALLLEVTGISLPPFVWALVGAALLQAYSKSECTRLRAILQVLLSCMAGAGIAVGVAQYAGITGAHVVNLLALIFGAFALPALQAVWTKLQEKINAI
jgi:uncharacterized membrane protein YgaE (UPF0421/DUF939 family)